MHDYTTLVGELDALFADPAVPTEAIAARLRERDIELVRAADASQAAAVALARESRAAEISAGLRRRARLVTVDWCDMHGSASDAITSLADDIDDGRL